MADTEKLEDDYIVVLNERAEAEVKRLLAEIPPNASAQWYIEALRAAMLWAYSDAALCFPAEGPFKSAEAMKIQSRVGAFLIATRGRDG